MPLYEYQCPQCGRFELIQKFSDAPVTSCPTCGSDVEKLLSAPAIQFKGTGWYITDYARKSSDAGKSGGASGDAGKTEAAKSEKSKSGDGASAGAAPSGGSSSSGGGTPA